jgi:hypothetical protein
MNTFEQREKPMNVASKENYPERIAEITVFDSETNTHLSILTNHFGRYCGYCRFSKRPVQEPKYNGILTYVPVHGGITFVNEDSGGMVYGFDTSHAGDEDNLELQNPDFVIAEAKRLAQAILVAAKWEPFYLKASETWVRAEVIQGFHDELEETYGITFTLTNNFGAMIAVICGSL